MSQGLIQKGLNALSDMVKGRRKIPTPGGNYVTDNYPHTGVIPAIMARRKARNAPPLTRGQTR